MRLLNVCSPFIRWNLHIDQTKPFVQLRLVEACSEINKQPEQPRVAVFLVRRQRQRSLRREVYLATRSKPNPRVPQLSQPSRRICSGLQQPRLSNNSNPQLLVG